MSLHQTLALALWGPSPDPEPSTDHAPPLGADSSTCRFHSNMTVGGCCAFMATWWCCATPFPCLLVKVIKDPRARHTHCQIHPCDLCQMPGETALMPNMPAILSPACARTLNSLNSHLTDPPPLAPGPLPHLPLWKMLADGDDDSSAHFTYWQGYAIKVG